MSPSAEERLAQENRRLRQELQAWQAQGQAWPSDKEALLTQMEALRTQKEALETQVAELEHIRRNLEHTVAVYKRCLFGSRSEKIAPQELEARIAQAAAEAREQLARDKRPGDPPPEAEEEQPEEKAEPATSQPLHRRIRRPTRGSRTNAKLARTAAALFQRICPVGGSSTRWIPRRPTARAARIIRP